MVFQESRELLAGEWAPLVRVEDGGRAIASQGLLDRLDAEVGRQRVGQPPRQHAATRPIHHREEIHEAPRHWNVGDIRRPHMVGACDLQVAKEIGIDLVGWVPAAEVRLPIHRRKAHASHQRGHVPPSNGLPLSPQEVPQHPGSSKRILQMQLVNPTHQGQLRP